ncbi:hypothetical protein Fmac_004943 [Flemingia macrophylla]|uniref:KIB1-4 beta-propeller domain-containing protein n=1 Tax=Flemingia macrophylla TaxID=520843 RepID=A0ABD1N6N9_9FABA
MMKKIFPFSSDKRRGQIYVRALRPPHHPHLRQTRPVPLWLPDRTIIPDMPTPYNDICIFRGMLHAIDNISRTVIVFVSDAALAIIVAPIFGSDKKFLVEFNGALLLVNLYLSNREFEDFDDYDVADIAIEWERTVRFDVFRLHQEEKRWVEVTSLGDRVLFLGNDCAFFASTNDLGVRRGNCIIFRDDGLGASRCKMEWGLGFG